MEALEKQVKTLLGQAEGVWSVIVEDLNIKQGFSIRGDKQYNAASIIKLPILAAAFSKIDQGEMTLDQKITLSQQDLVGGSGVLQHLSPGLEISVHDLLVLMIIQSDNTATNMIIDLVGESTIQQVMQQLGMENSGFYNRLMIIPAERESSNLVTAEDVAKLLKAFVLGHFISYDSCKRMIKIMKQQQIHYLTAYFPDPDTDVIGSAPSWSFASKTGNVTGVYHDTGILYVGKRACIVSVLSEQVKQEAAMQTYHQLGKMLHQYMA